MTKRQLNNFILALSQSHDRTPVSDDIFQRAFIDTQVSGRGFCEMYLNLWISRLIKRRESDKMFNPSDKDLQLLQRREGGLGGNNNQTDRQLRFMGDPGDTAHQFTGEEEICIIAFPSNDGKEVWNPVELCIFAEEFSLMLASLGCSCDSVKIVPFSSM